MEEIHQAPKWPLNFFRWYCREDYVEDLEGDLQERYELNMQDKGRSYARKQFLLDVLKLFRPGIIQFKVNTQHSNAMTRHHFLIGYRNLLRNKWYSFLNIGGLALGMTIAILIGLWLHDEFTFNEVHDQKNRIVQILRKNSSKGETFVSRPLPGKLGPILDEQYKDLFDQIVIIRGRLEERAFANGRKRFSQKGYYMQDGGAEMFSLKMLQGSRSGLKDVNSIFLSQTLADKLFDRENPIGKFITMDNAVDLEVTGVYEDLPRNSTFNDASFFISLDRFITGKPWLFAWDNYNMWIYGKLSEGATSVAASESIEHLMKGHTGNQNGYPRAFAHPMNDWHFKSDFENGVPVLSETWKFVILYGMVGIFVLLLACINFINLSTARSEKRAKEVGIRKTFGSVRIELIRQFLTESFLYVFLAFLLSVVAAWSLLDWFNQVADKQLVMPFDQPIFWLAGLALTLATALISGSYPAFYLSHFQPISVLKKIGFSGRSSILGRRTLVVFQFTISMILIITSLVVQNQINFVKSRPVGYSQSGLLTLRSTSPEFEGKYELLRQELIATGMVTDIAQANYPITTTLGNMDDFMWDGKADYDPTFNMVIVNYDYGNTIGWEVVEGRDFSRDITSDQGGGIIINEAAQKVMGMENPVGQTITSRGGYAGLEKFRIVGVVKDLLKGSPFEPVQESIMILADMEMSNTFIRINPEVSTSEALIAISETFDELLPNTPFHYEFVDDVYARKFDLEERVGRLSSFFTLLACLISCLGLLGLAAYSAERRTKEIGIRKVLGASILNLWQLMSKEYTWLVLIALIFAIPISYFLMSSWLASYTFKVDLEMWVFVLAGIGTLLITHLTVSSQALKAATRNPTEVLHDE
ncbi:MAG: ABC transporter permease [Cytophagales bacterium]|nr:ABC transporter permease [Cytophagales bacterium]